ncbi:MAG TPA: (d)CMP kinase [Acidimicrobiia bacterium]|nr:(d)CMP kinase [Acidimicrobiia bacterium]
MKVLAVDGPGGAGKSTVSRALASRLGWLHLDTGAFYRAATLAVQRAEVNPDDAAAVAELVDRLKLRQEGGLMFLDGDDVSDEIRIKDVTATVSRVSSHPEVRRILVRHQRQWVAGHPGPVVVEGRDIGSVVFPDADLKIWLVASSAERARRRAAETGEPVSVVAADLARRDAADSTRRASPQKPAADAIWVDTTNLAIDTVVERIVAMIVSPSRVPPHLG